MTTLRLSTTYRRFRKADGEAQGLITSAIILTPVFLLIAWQVVGKLFSVFF